MPAPSQPGESSLGRRRIRVLKFGGSSLGDATRIRIAVRIVQGVFPEHFPVVVVSALEGVTDTLCDLTSRAVRRGRGLRSGVEALAQRHGEILAAVAPEHERGSLEARIEKGFRQLADLLLGARLVRESSESVRDRILGFGELFSAQLVAAALRDAGYSASPVNARSLIQTDDWFGAARVDEATSLDRIRSRLLSGRRIPVVTGFVAQTADGRPTTLGRGASDHTATLVGAALDAERVELWTDVDGIRTADPTVVRDAAWIEELGYEELFEIACFGAKVVHPAAVHPAKSRGIPVLVRNVGNPAFPGTRVVDRPRSRRSRPVQGISAIRDVVLVRLEGSEGVGITEIAERLFRVLRSQGVTPFMFSGDSSAKSLSLVVREERAASVASALVIEFERERRAGVMGEPIVERGRSLVALVGEGMRSRAGVSGTLFGAFGDERINVQAIAQGSSERNISCLVSGEDEVRAVRAAHRAFFTASSPPELPIYVVGVGVVGSCLLDRLAEGGLAVVGARGVRPTLAGILRSDHAVIPPARFDGRGWREILGTGRTDPSDVFTALETGGRPAVVVDCTASPEVAERYEKLLRGGVTIVTANKLALSGPFSTYRTIRALGGETGFLYGTTVGAGLPMLESLARLHAVGEPILSIRGVLSGSLAYVFHALHTGQLFRQALRKAREEGLTEPDPRADLRLGDVARKLLILSREAGTELEPHQIAVEPVLPDDLLRSAEGLEGFEPPEDADAWLGRRVTTARAEGGRLLPVARLDDGRATVGLEVVPANSPMAHLRGTENLLEVRTPSYDEHPLVIRGPGAGPRVTARGLLDDLVRAAGVRSAIRNGR